MNLSINAANIDTNARELKLSLDVVIKIQEMESYRFEEKFMSHVAEQVAQRVLDLHMSEILKKVDLEAIVRRVQMNVIQDISRK
jgi:hypothetical protein